MGRPAPLHRRTSGGWRTRGLAYDMIARPRAVEVAPAPIGGDERAVEPAATPPAAGSGGEAGR
jgi:hypothetical protein